MITKHVLYLDQDSNTLPFAVISNFVLTKDGWDQPQFKFCIEKILNQYEENEFLNWIRQVWDNNARSRVFPWYKRDLKIIEYKVSSMKQTSDLSEFDFLYGNLEIMRELKIYEGWVDELVLDENDLGIVTLRFRTSVENKV